MPTARPAQATQTVHQISSPSTSELPSFPPKGASIQNPFVIHSAQTTPARERLRSESPSYSSPNSVSATLSENSLDDSKSILELGSGSIEASPSRCAVPSTAEGTSPSYHKHRYRSGRTLTTTNSDFSSSTYDSRQDPLEVLSSPSEYSNVNSEHSFLDGASDLLRGETPGLPDNRRMVREREPPRAPLSPTNRKQQSPQDTTRYPDLRDNDVGGKDRPNSSVYDASSQPFFGRPTQLGASNSPNLQRPKHPPVSKPDGRLFHKPKTDYNPIHYLHTLAKDRPFQPPTSSQSQPHPHKQNIGVPIRPTSNPTYSTQTLPERQYTSQPFDSYIDSQSSKLQNFVDLTGGNISSSTAPENFGYRINKFEPEIFIDSAKAHENIKDLLEGAFEDEDDKPRTRLRKKKVDTGAAELVAKLQGISVDDGEAAQGGEDVEEAEEFDGAVEGLKVKLLPHQIEGYEWMLEKENGTKKTRGVLPKGGILADDMGLGKTVQSIALIMTNQKPSEAKIDEMNASKEKIKRTLPIGLDKGTLVVAPLALIKQWESEIRDKVLDSHSLRVLVHHGPQRAKQSKDLKKYDVVITTYNTLTSEHASSSETIKTGCFGVHWYRVILDEAHSIKNRTAKQTQAACALRAEYRWCLTGTPMQNNLDELQSLIKFLRIKPYDELSAWREQITKPMNSGRGGLAIKRLQVYLKAFMKRRTKDVLKQEGALKTGTTIDAAGDSKTESFRLVKRDIERVEAEFSPAERRFYEGLEQRTDNSLKRMIAGDSLSYASALTLLLRLRQVCNHPKLVKSDLSKEKDGFETMKAGSQSPRKKTVRDEDVDDITNLMGGLGVNTKQCDVCQAELSKSEIAEGAVRCVDCEAALEDEEIKPQKKEKKKYRDKEKRKDKNSQTGVTKPERKQRNRRIVTDSDDEEEDEGEWLVAENARETPKLGRAGGSDDENAEGGGEWLGSDDSDEDVKPSGRREKKKVISLDTEDEEENESDEESSSSANDSEEDNDDRLISPLASTDKTQDLILSTKIRHLLSILQRHAPHHKFIIFSFFTSMLDLIEPFLSSSPSRSLRRFTRYDGQMRPDAREAALNKLRNDPKCRILLCSLKSGSLGLNLTAASRVIILEPFWNPFVEEQAIDRVHRLNQTEDVVVYKITVRDTVEARILELQERKRELAEATIEGKGKAAAKLSMREMLALFRHDAESKAVVDGIGMGIDKGKGKGRLVERGDDGRSGSAERTLQGSGSERRGNGMMQKKTSSTTAPARKEDAVYGRRW